MQLQIGAPAACWKSGEFLSGAPFLKLSLTSVNAEGRKLGEDETSEQIIKRLSLKQLFPLIPLSLHIKSSGNGISTQDKAREQLFKQRTDLL